MSEGSPDFEAELPVRVHAPERRTSRLVFASPHSGRNYPDAFLALVRLPLALLRRSEDAYVDELIAAAPACGASLVEADFPRTWVDANRARWEFDPAMFDGPLPPEAGPATARAAAGLGVVPRLAADGRAIYGGPIAFEEARRRVERGYVPYHQAVKREIERACETWGEAVLIDCHSMPSASARGADIVLGDRFGASCSEAVVTRAERGFRDLGFSVVRNRPYAGGYTTEHYGRPSAGVHVLQVEINRGLYLEEAAVERSARFEAAQAAFSRWIQWMTLEDEVQAAAE
ncbi:N-formylglutamate amidohydrolase [Marinicauda salina]|uniref:N-formylglutamate amidohydrolase n=1 Tax=Marinicauda salina TaxID=2135793 RepID=A0A2U2BXD4_9PROT|nr:N-formylglutamate amidohydrolase [Marinicauda salina]PWE18672.1 N-formylglutamate amidohydrolase [Marinicauda salina]